jgi:hypothetical protein
MQSKARSKIGSPAKGVNKSFYFYQPLVRSENFALFQDLDGDGRIDQASSTSPPQELEFRNDFLDSSPIDGKILTDQRRLKFHLDIDGDGSPDLIFIEVKEIFSQNINVFPFAKVFIHMKKNGRFAQTPDFFQKTILVSDQAPFVDVDGDGDLDFISVWSEITPGSKEDILQVLLDSTWSFTLRCYLFDKDTGYSLTPHVSLQAKIKQDISQLSLEIPFDLSGDFDGNGSRDLIIKKDPESWYLYFFDLKAKKHITRVKRLDTPTKPKGYQIVDLDGNGRSDIIFFTAQGARIYFSNAE